MNANLARAYDRAQTALVAFSAPALKREITPLRPPIKPATATLAEIARFKVVANA